MASRRSPRRTRGSGPRGLRSLQKRHPRCLSSENTSIERHRAPRARIYRPVQDDPAIGHLDALYALSYLTSGDADNAQDVVIEAFRRLAQGPPGLARSRSRSWRHLADYVGPVSDRRELLPGGPVPGPFKQARLPSDQREAIALLLVGTREIEAAWLVGIPMKLFRSHVHGGLTVLHAAWLPGTAVPACPCLPVGSRSIGAPVHPRRGPQV